MEELFENLLKNLNTGSDCDPSLMSPPVLAYMGDSIHNLYIRCFLVSKHPSNVNKYHKLSINYVSAHSQSEVLHKIHENLTEKEQYIIKRGRNAKSGSIPKNADITEYKHATGFETLIGYLFYSGDINRLLEILKMSADSSFALAQDAKSIGSPDSCEPKFTFGGEHD